MQIFFIVMLSLQSLGMQKIPHNLQFRLAKTALKVVQFGQSYTIFHIIVRQEKHRDLDVFDVIYLRRPPLFRSRFRRFLIFYTQSRYGKNPHNLKIDLKKHALKSFTSSKVRKILRIVEQEKNNWILIFLTSLIREGLDYPGLDPVITSFPMHSPGIQNTTYNLKFLMKKIPSKMT